MLARWRIFVASAVCLAGLLLMTGLQAWELREHYAQQQDRLQRTTARLESLRALQEQHPDLEQYQMEIESQRRHVDQLLPDTMDVAGLLPQLQKNALKSKLEIRELLPGAAAKEKGLTVLPLQVRVVGDYFGLLEFVRSLENGAPFCQVAAMELEQKDNSLSALLRINVFSI